MAELKKILGNIYMSNRALATIASESALESYGVVGITGKNVMTGIAKVLVKDPTLGVNVTYENESLVIDIYVIIEYGTRVQSVANSVSENIKYQVEKATGLTVTQVNVHVRGLRISYTD